MTICHKRILDNQQDASSYSPSHKNRQTNNANKEHSLNANLIFYNKKNLDSPIWTLLEIPVEGFVSSSTGISC